jgi:sulfide dehydrogenase cytochrome subunit
MEVRYEFSPQPLLFRGSSARRCCCHVRIFAPHAADLNQGRSLAASCAGCHGANWAGTPGFTPALTGSTDAAIATALRDFRDGKRKGATMTPISASLTDDQIEAVAAFIANSSPPVKK